MTEKKELKSTLSLAIDYLNWRGGTNNLHRVRVMSGSHAVKKFTSRIGKAELAARKWGKKNGIVFACPGKVL